MNPRWLLRMVRWSRRPPSAGRVKFVLAIVALCLVLYAIQQIWGWPEALTPARMGHRGYKP